MEAGRTQHGGVKAMKEQTQSNRGRKMRFVSGLGMVAMLLAQGGCEVDSWFNPAVVGRWERTPVILPILDQLDVIDEQAAKAPGTRPVIADDLIEFEHEYVIGSGDLITFTIFELIMPNIETVQTRRVDELGIVRLPVMGALKVRAATPSQVEGQIAQILNEMDVVRDAEVSVIIQEGRQSTYSVIGEPRSGSTGIGTYTIPHPNFRILQAMALARGIPGRTKTIYIIRSANYVEQQLGITPSIRMDQEAYNRDRRTTSPQLGLIDQLTEGIDQDIAGDPMHALGTALNGNSNGNGNGSGGQWIYRNGEWVRLQGAPTAGSGSRVVHRIPKDASEIAITKDGRVDRIIPDIVEIHYNRLLDGDLRSSAPAT